MALTAANKYIVAALRADILLEAEMAGDCLRRAASAPPQHLGTIRHRADRCAAAALRNATALAAEGLLLGGTPPGKAHRRHYRRRGAESIEEYLVQARSAMAHYQHRLAMAEQLGSARLREVFQEIVLSKRRHLAHAVLVAAEGSRPRQLS